MSCNRGFAGGGVDADPGYASNRDTGFGSAMGAYGSRSVGPDPVRSRAAPPPGASALAGPPSIALPKVNMGVRLLKFTADNAVMIAVDTTGSMSEWPLEMFDRLGLLYNELVDILQGTVQILFIGFGDIPLCKDPFEVTPIGSGPELLVFLAAIQKKSNGGGNSIESSDLALEFGARMVDTTACKHVYQFVITDEMVAPSTDFGEMKPWVDTRGRTVSPRPVSEVVRDLRAKQDTFAIIKPYGSVPELREGQDPDVLFRGSMTQDTLVCWERVLGADWLSRLWDKRRVVDVIIGCIAKRVGKEAEFVSRLRSRHLTPGNKYGPMNVSTVLTSIATVGGSVTKPAAKSRMLLADDVVIDVDPLPASAALPVARSVCLLPPGSGTK